MTSESLAGYGRRQLVELQLEMECVRVEAENLLVPFPCPNPDLPPRVLVADTGESCIVYIRNDVPDGVRAELARLSPQTCASDEEAVCTILGWDRPY